MATINCFGRFRFPKRARSDFCARLLGAGSAGAARMKFSAISLILLGLTACAGPPAARYAVDEATTPDGAVRLFVMSDREAGVEVSVAPMVASIWLEE